MAKSMVIVESPAKARTIGKYLGDKYLVRASSGHIKDLPPRALGVNIKQDFDPTYKVIPGKEKILRDLKSDAKKIDAIYLAADPDREGEAICYHLATELNGKSGHTVHRVLFNEITRNAIEAAFENPGVIDVHKVEAQQARRILDRLVGYKISPLLWQKVRRGLSAGRVQTVALRMIVEREREIEAFEPEEYWNFSARLLAGAPPVLEARAVEHDGKKFKISNEEEADALSAELEGQDFVVGKITKKERRRNPRAPYTTSQLQQDAVRLLGFSVKKTMTLAQRLYEGVELGDRGSVGLITYMRTDSTRVAPTALDEVRRYIGDEIDPRYLPDKARSYRTKKGAQDAHEAVRPTAVDLHPNRVKSHLGRDELRLYTLIWKRFVASQMKSAVFDQTEIEITCGRTLFRAVGSILKFDGFLKIYQPPVRPGDEKKGEGNLLPDVEEGQKLKVEEILREQKFTQPPPRFNEASLVKTLEERGIGRPSTYQQIISVIQSREYVLLVEKRFRPSELGMVVNDLLIGHFGDIFDYDYTARLERDLDRIEEGEENWVKALRGFYDGFKKTLETAREEMRNVKAEATPIDEKCTKCGSQMVIKWGRFGRFIACSNYPECRNTRELESDGGDEDNLSVEAECPRCGKDMLVKKGRYGAFLACSDYPECKTTRKLVKQSDGTLAAESQRVLDEKCPQCGKQLARRQGRFGEFTACSEYPECRFIKPDTTGIQCPECQEGEIVRRRSRRGRVFYGCGRYPDCEYVVWNQPVPETCPECNSPFLLQKTTKRDGTVRLCPVRDCSYKREVPDENEEAGASEASLEQ